MSNTKTIAEEMENIGRDGRLVTEALYHLCNLKKAGYITGGTINMTEAGMKLGQAIAEANEFTQDELSAAALLVMQETGGVKHG